MSKSQKPGTLTLIQPGLFTLLVDQGRPRSRHLGVPVGGAADRASLALGNGLVDNDPFTPALEINLQGPTVIADVDLTCVVYGAPITLHVEDRAIPAQRPFQLPANHPLRIGSISEGARAYFCAQGGLSGQAILGSQSGFTPLVKDDQLQCCSGDRIRRYLKPGSVEWDRTAPIRILPAAQTSWFADDSLQDQDFVVQGSSNRMGLRLESEPIPVPERELVSEPVCPGSIQVTKNGQLVILGVDGQTIGGYPKVAQVAHVDLDRVGQLRPGDVARFQWVTMEQAQSLLQDREQELKEWLVRLRVSASL